MAVELIVNNRNIEISENTPFQFNFTVADIFNIGMVASSYSNAFQAPSIASNIQALEGLGLVGSNSQVPYKKIPAVVKYDGFDVVSNGSLNVMETGASFYQLSILEGMTDFFKDIENKTIGNHVNGIDVLTHKKTIGNFKKSIVDGDIAYTYIIADFGGKMQLPNNVINIDYLVPAVRISYLWNRIFETFGYTFSGSIFSNPDFVDAMITFPQPPDAGEETTNETFFSKANKSNFRDEFPVQEGSNRWYFPNSYNWSTPGTGFSNWNFKATELNTFRIRVKPIGYMRVASPNGNPIYETQVPFTFEVCKGDTVIGSFSSQYSSSADFESYFVDFALTEGELINFRIRNFASYEPVFVQINSIELNVYTTDGGSFDFQETFADFSIKDFVKEMIIRFGLTPIYDGHLKHIRFLTIDEKIDFGNSVDWSSKYVKREKESYLYGSFAQNNLLTHKYNEESNTFNNGNISISNSNIEVSRTVYASKIYSSEQTVRTYNIGNGYFKTNVYPVWKPEIKEGQNGIEIDYKGLNGRYYITKIVKVFEEGKFKSELLNSNIELTPFYYVPSNNNVHFNQLVARYYQTYQRILNNFKMHTIEVALSAPDVIGLDFTKLYYFDQEASFYMLNKLQWQEGKTCKGEFIKVNK